MIVRDRPQTTDLSRHLIAKTRGRGKMKITRGRGENGGFPGELRDFESEIFQNFSEENKLISYNLDTLLLEKTASNPGFIAGYDPRRRSRSHPRPPFHASPVRTRRESRGPRIFFPTRAEFRSSSRVDVTWMGGRRDEPTFDRTTTYRYLIAKMI